MTTLSTKKLAQNHDAIRSIMKSLDETMLSIFIEEKAVAMPLIGAGLAGGSWSIISKIIVEESNNFQPVVYTLDGKIPTS